MGSMTGENIFDLNKDIEMQNMEILKEKRLQNVYDLIGLSEDSHYLYDRVSAILVQVKAKMVLSKSKVELIPLKDAPDKSFYSEQIKIYMDKMLIDTVLILHEGFVFIIQIGETVQTTRLLIQPFNFLTDVQKIIFSDDQENFLALRLRDMRKTNNRDHIIFELKDRELFADYVMDYAE